MTCDVLLEKKEGVVDGYIRREIVENKEKLESLNQVYLKLERGRKEGKPGKGGERA